VVSEILTGSPQLGLGVEEFVADGLVLLQYRTRGKARVKGIEVKKCVGRNIDPNGIS
jgi:KaiC/GvpD/RAD55 family RecA-like ATPase